MTERVVDRVIADDRSVVAAARRHVQLQQVPAVAGRVSRRPLHAVRTTSGTRSDSESAIRS